MPINFAESPQFVQKPRVETYYDYTTPSLKVTAQPVGISLDTSALEAWQQKQKEKAAVWSSFANFLSSAIPVYKTAEAKAEQEGALKAVKGEELEPLNLRNFLTYKALEKGYSKAKAQLELVNYQADVALWWEQNKNKYVDTEEMQQAMQEFMNTWLQERADKLPADSKAFQEEFFTKAQEFNTQLLAMKTNEQYQKLVEEIANTNFAALKQTTEESIINSLYKGLNIDSLDDLNSLAQSAIVNPAVLETEWNNKAILAKELRTQLSQLQQRSKEFNMTRDQVAEVFVEEIGELATTYGMPELLDFVDEPDESGIKLSNTKLANKIAQYKEAATKTRLQAQAQWQEYENQWNAKKQELYKNALLVNIGLLKTAVSSNDVTQRVTAKVTAQELLNRLQNDPTFMSLEDQGFVKSVVNDLSEVANTTVQFAIKTDPNIKIQLERNYNKLTTQDVVQYAPYLTQADFEAYMKIAQQNEQKQANIIKQQKLNQILAEGVTEEEYQKALETALKTGTFDATDLTMLYKEKLKNTANQDKVQFKQQIYNDLALFDDPAKIPDKYFDQKREEASVLFAHDATTYDSIVSWLDSLQKSKEKALEEAKTKKTLDTYRNLDVQIRSGQLTYSEALSAIIDAETQGLIQPSQAGSLWNLAENLLKPQESELMTKPSIKLAREMLDNRIKTWSTDVVLKTLNPDLAAQYDTWRRIFETNFEQNHAEDYVNYTDQQLYDLYYQEVIEPLEKIYKQGSELGELPQPNITSYQDIINTAQKWLKNSASTTENEKVIIDKVLKTTTATMINQGVTQQAEPLTPSQLSALMSKVFNMPPKIAQTATEISAALDIATRVPKDEPLDVHTWAGILYARGYSTAQIQKILAFAESYKRLDPNKVNVIDLVLKKISEEELLEGIVPAIFPRPMNTPATPLPTTFVDAEGNPIIISQTDNQGLESRTVIQNTPNQEPTEQVMIAQYENLGAKTRRSDILYNQPPYNPAKTSEQQPIQQEQATETQTKLYAWEAPKDIVNKADWIIRQDIKEKTEGSKLFEAVAQKYPEINQSDELKTKVRQGLSYYEQLYLKSGALPQNEIEKHLDNLVPLLQKAADDIPPQVVVLLSYLESSFGAEAPNDPFQLKPPAIADVKRLNKELRNIEATKVGELTPEQQIKVAATYFIDGAAHYLAAYNNKEAKKALGLRENATKAQIKQAIKDKLEAGLIGPWVYWIYGIYRGGAAAAKPNYQPDETFIRDMNNARIKLNLKDPLPWDTE